MIEDLGADAVKTGMLASAALIRTVADRVCVHGLRTLVVDPVMVAKSGDPLLEADAVAALRDELLPLALVVTPNRPEAERLTGRAVRSLAEAREAARALVALGARHAVVKGGHADGPAIDVLFEENLIEKSAAQGAYLLGQLSTLQSPLIREVRGKGLFVGIEVDRERIRARDVVDRLLARGILSKDTHGTVIRFAPPLTIDRETIDVFSLDASAKPAQ